MWVEVRQIEPAPKFCSREFAFNNFKISLQGLSLSTGEGAEFFQQAVVARLGGGGRRECNTLTIMENFSCVLLEKMFTPHPPPMLDTSGYHCQRDSEFYTDVMAEYAIKNVVLESNLSRRDRYVVLLFFALYTDIAFVLLKNGE
jgi:hypothetical protein